MAIETTEWIVAIGLLVGVGAPVFWLKDLISRGRMMRCPETGAVTYVCVERDGGDADARGLTATHCDLWPARKNCRQGCLARYSETAPGLRINIDALRAYERDR
jgi:hypothetical protein